MIHGTFTGRRPALLAPRISRSLLHPGVQEDRSTDPVSSCAVGPVIIRDSPAGSKIEIL